jgi:hypothetical protein
MSGGKTSDLYSVKLIKDPIPLEWNVVVESHTQKLFYENSQDKKTQWERPEVV